MSEKPVPRKIRVLMLEDQISDAELVLHELRRAGFEAGWERVQSESEYLAHLDPALDVILADYNLPRFDALTALRLLRERGLETPFIIVSGSIGEEIAVEAMKLGADDYILKDRMARLGKAVARVLEERRLRGEGKRAEAALEESEQRYRLLVEGTPDAILVHCDGAIEFANPAAKRLLGADHVAQLLGKPTMEIVPPEDRSLFQKCISQTTAQGKVPLMELRIVRLDGAVVEVEAVGIPFTYSGRPAVQIVVRAITERKRAEQRLVTQHAITQALADSSTLAEAAKNILQLVCQNLQWNIGELWTIESTSRALRCFEIWHPAAPAFHEFATARKQLMLAVGEDLPGQVCATTAAAWVEEMEKVRLAPTELASRIGMRTAVAFPIKLHEEVIGVMVFFSEQSRPPDHELLTLFASVGSQLGQFVERQRIEEQFRHAQKMEAIGTLAGGIAHDFNNILTAIIGFGQVLRSEIQPDHAWHEPMREILKAADRAKDLVRRILTFSRKQGQQRIIATLDPVISEVVSLLRASLPSTIEISATIDTGCPAVLADPTQIHQVLMNLATNAAYAMRDKNGRLTLALNCVEVGSDLVLARPSLRLGPYVRLTVSDTGCGMDGPTRARIFDPFFTTKPPGEGTGLGLSVVHGVMEDHDGAITVESELGKGTTFRLYFPAVTTAAEQVMPGPMEMTRGKGERILFVDDELVLCELAEQILQRIGYVPVTFHNAEEALAAVRATPNGFDAVVTDLTMPRMTGFTLAAELRRLRPNLPIVLMTGYAGALNRKQAHEFGIDYFVAKPFSPEALAETLQKALSVSA